MEYEVLYVSNNIKTVENKERNSDFNTISLLQITKEVTQTESELNS